MWEIMWDVVDHVGYSGSCGMWWIMWDIVAHVGCGGSCGMWWLMQDVVSSCAKWLLIGGMVMELYSCLAVTGELAVWDIFSSRNAGLSVSRSVR
jgi:hypothetical protein